jgi:hypothetical protein
MKQDPVPLKNNNQMKISKIICLLSICFYWLGSNAQDNDKNKIKEIFKQTENYYKEVKECSLNIHFKMYESETSNNIFEKYDGILIKNGKMSYSKIGQTEFVNLGDKIIKIDNQNKKIKIGNNSSNPNATIESLNLMPYLNFAKKLSLINDNDQWICTLEMGDVSFVPYKKMIIYINKKTHEIIKQKLYFFSKYKIKKNNNKIEYDFPRLEIEFDEIKQANPINTQIFKRENYIQTISNHYVPSSNYKDYTIVK